MDAGARHAPLRRLELVGPAPLRRFADAASASPRSPKPRICNVLAGSTGKPLRPLCMDRAWDRCAQLTFTSIRRSDRYPRARRCSAGVRAFFAFLDSDRAAWAVLFDETLPRGGEIADRVAEYRGRILELVSGVDARADARLGASAPRRSRSRRSPTALLGAAEALARWWLRTEAISARGGGRAADRDRSSPACACRSAPLTRVHNQRERRSQVTDKPRRVAVVGGNRIPFARSNCAYAHASNQDMLTAALDGLVDRFGLEGERLGEVAGGAVLKHSRDRDLTRESVLGTRLAAETPAYDVQQACGTGLETTILVANKIALGQIDAGHRLRRRHHLRRADRRSTRTCARRCSTPTGRRSTAGKLRALTGVRPGHVVPAIPRNEEPRTGLSMGEHCAIMADRVGDRPRRAGRAHRRQPPATSPPPMSAASSTTWSPPTSASSATRTCAPTPASRSWRSWSRSSAAEDGTMTAANSTPLSDGASAVLLASEEWAKERDLPVLAYLVEAQTAAVDHVHKREGLLMAPAYAMPRDARPRRPRPAGLRPLRDPRGLRRAGALHAEGLGGPGASAARASAATSRSARSTARSSTSTAARWPPATRSPRPAGASSPASPRSCTRTARAAA